RPGRWPSWPKERDCKSRTCRKVGRGFESRPLRSPCSSGFRAERKVIVGTPSAAEPADPIQGAENDGRYGAYRGLLSTCGLEKRSGEWATPRVRSIGHLLGGSDYWAPGRVFWSGSLRWCWPCSPRLRTSCSTRRPSLAARLRSGSAP